IAVCRQKSDQLDRLVADLFAYTRVEYLEQTLKRQPVELGALFARAVDSLRPRAQAARVDVGVQGPANVGVIPVDAHLLERAVENLHGNALRHTPASRMITLTWQVEAHRATFAVDDSGPGVAPQDVPHMFAPLYPGNPSRNPETGGV